VDPLKAQRNSSHPAPGEHLQPRGPQRRGP